MTASRAISISVSFSCSQSFVAGGVGFERHTKWRSPATPPFFSSPDLKGMLNSEVDGFPERYTQVALVYVSRFLEPKPTFSSVFYQTSWAFFD